LLQSNLYIAFEAISVGQRWLLDSEVLAIAMVFGKRVNTRFHTISPDELLSGLLVFRGRRIPISKPGLPRLQLLVSDEHMADAELRS
jgi:hypothetical protein